MTIRKVNASLKGAVIRLEKQSRVKKSAIWGAAARTLSRGSVTRVAVNVDHLSGATEGSPAVFVPGKVLGTGVLDKKLVVGAYAFSAAARRKIVEAGGEAIGVEEFLERYPEGSGVVLVG